MTSYCVHCTKRNTVNHEGICSACFSDSIIYYCKCDNNVLVFGKNERCLCCLEDRPDEIWFEIEQEEFPDGPPSRSSPVHPVRHRVTPKYFVQNLDKRRTKNARDFFRQLKVD